MSDGTGSIAEVVRKLGALMDEEAAITSLKERSHADAQEAGQRQRQLEVMGNLLGRALEGPCAAEDADVAAFFDGLLATGRIRLADASAAAVAERERTMRVLERSKAEHRGTQQRLLARLLVEHQLPGVTWTYRYEHERAATAEATACTSFGLEVRMRLALPPKCLLGHRVRLEKLAGKLEVTLPAGRTWRRRAGLRPVPLGRYRIHKAIVGPEESVLVLRGGGDGVGGYRVVLDRTASEPSVTAVALSKQGDPEGTCVTLSRAEAAQLRGAWNRIEHMMLLGSKGAALVAARLEDRVLTQDDGVTPVVTGFARALADSGVTAEERAKLARFGVEPVVDSAVAELTRPEPVRELSFLSELTLVDESKPWRPRPRVAPPPLPPPPR